MVCDMVFKDQTYLKMYMDKHIQESTFKCKDCENSYKSESDLEQHVMVHKSEELYKCGKCDKKFVNQANLKQHQQEHMQKQVGCKYCNEMFMKDSDVKEHLAKHHGKLQFDCVKCNKIFANEQSLFKHQETHKDEFVCTKCDKAFLDNKQLIEHDQCHGNLEFKCEKCDKSYGEMRKLRRHDWRCHRSIECTICSEILESRLEIAKHRQDTHKMFRKMNCRYYPDCYDGDECLFEHNGENSEIKTGGCPNGQGCSDQECTFNEKEHMKLSQLCKFQEKCYRISCPYQHNSSRKSFLGTGPLGKIRK